MICRWLGLQEYETIYQKQKQSLAWEPDRQEVWGLEHPLIMTLGRRAHLAQELSPAFDGNRSCQVPSLQIDRGGLATVHNPGQLVIYPLLSLRKQELGVKDYICALLTITRKTLQMLNIETDPQNKGMTNSSVDLSGLFVGGKKICFVGLRVSQGRTYHGLSLNVRNDLSHFDFIRACGVQGRPLTSLSGLGRDDLTPEIVFNLWSQIASRYFGHRNLYPRDCNLNGPQDLSVLT